MQDSNALALEILKQTNGLSMGLFERKEFASTIKNYSQCSVSFTEIDKLCQEALFILNKANKRGALEPDLIHSLKKTGQLLWDHLFTKSVKDRLRTTQILDLVLSLDEELINIPWELLYTGEDFLCLKFNLGRLVRTKGQIQAPQYRSARGILKMLILANPTADLKSAYLEGIHIKNQFARRKNEIRIDFKSTHIDTMYVKKNLRDYDIVHFAGHCEYDGDNPKNTGWLLDDGRFTTQDILALGESPALVFSNACQSAKFSTDLMEADYQEKTYGLAAAFLFSGTRHYIGTTYKIEDPVSLVFAQEFYTQLIKGKLIGECMRLSRLRLIKEYGIATIPWAAYLLYGDPGFALFRPKPQPAILGLKRRVALQKYKNSLRKLALAVSIISICIYLYMWLPTINPNAYILFIKAQDLFIKGRNQEVVSISQELIKKDPMFLAVYPLVADTYRRLGDQDNALKYYFDYLLYSQRRQDKKNLAAAYIGIGWIYHLQGEYPKAFDFYNKALALSRDNNDNLNEAVALRKLAVYYIDKQDYAQALELLTKSSEINRMRQHIYQHRYNLACDYFDIGLVFVNKDDFYAKSQRLFEKLKLKNELSDYYFNLGEIYLFEKQYQKALDCYTKGLKIDQGQGNRPGVAGDYNMIGELYIEMDNLEEAENFFHQSILVCKEIKSPIELASAYYNLGLLYKKKGKINKAREYLRQAQEIYRLIDTPDYQEIKKEFLELSNQ